MAENQDGSTSTDGDKGSAQTTTDAEDKSTTSLNDIDDETFDAERAKELIRKQRESEKDLRKQNAEMAKQLKAREDADLSEAEKLKKERDEAKAERDAATSKLKERDVQDAVKEVAKSLKFKDAGDALRFIDRDKLQFDDDGKITNAETLLKEVAQSKPYLVSGRQSADGGAGKGSDTGSAKTGNQQMNDALRAATGRGR